MAVRQEKSTNNNADEAIYFERATTITLPLD